MNADLRPTHPIEPMRPGLLAAQRNVAKRMVTMCSACDLRSACSVAPLGADWPARDERRPARFTIVVPSPTPEDDKRQKLLSSKWGKAIRAAVNRVGRDFDLDMDDAAVVPAVSCPTINGGYRAPSIDEMRSCRRHLFTQLVAANAPYVLLIGAQSLAAFRNDLTIEWTRRNFYTWQHTFIVTAVHSPAAFTHNPGLRRQWESDLYAFMEQVARDPRGVGSGLTLASDCGKCGPQNGGAVTWDRDGVGWCFKHKDMAKGAEKSDAYWRESRVDRQMELGL